MNYDPAIHNRRSIRLKGYDYSRPGGYFLTICTQKRKFLFGDVVGGEMQLNDAGRMVSQWYMALENKFPDIACDAFVCMPNHVHFIIFIVAAGSPDPAAGADPCVRPSMDPCARPDPAAAGADPCVRPSTDPCVRPIKGQTHGSARTPQVVQWFKTMTTNAYIRGVKELGWAAFPGRLWQRNYWDRIIRDERALENIRAYIEDNPAKWMRRKPSADAGFQELES